MTNDEPLKKDSPLWDLENLILSQHTGGGSETETLDKIDFFLNNLKRFTVDKKKLINKVNLLKGY